MFAAPYFLARRGGTVAAPSRALLPFVIVALGLAGCGEGDEFGTDLNVIEVADVGFAEPAAIIMDTIADVYFVSNMNGVAGEKSGNGFISKVSPEGEVLELRWADPLAGGQELHSPRGMAIRSDSLFVADVDCVRFLLRESGEARARICLDGASFLTDLDVGPEGSIFVVDRGERSGENGLEPTGTDAVFRLSVAEGQRGSTIARGPELGGPTGIAVGSRGIFVTTARTGELYRLTPAGEKTSLVPPSNAHLDGVVLLPDGGFAFSSWTESTIFLVDGATGQLSRLIEGVETPGVLGYDPRRNRLLVPLTSENRVLFVELP